MRNDREIGIFGDPTGCFCVVIYISWENVCLDGEKGMSPALKPYPDWATNKIHEMDNTTKIVSTFRIRVDECDRLWVLDTGLADILGKAEQITPPKILIYDLKTDKVRGDTLTFVERTNTCRTNAKS